jgi:hypothetical protein
MKSKDKKGPPINEPLLPASQRQEVKRIWQKRSCSCETKDACSCETKDACSCETKDACSCETKDEKVEFLGCLAFKRYSRVFKQENKNSRVSEVGFFVV